MKQSSHPSAESFAAQELTAGIKVEIHALQLGHASVPHLASGAIGAHTGKPMPTPCREVTPGVGGSAASRASEQRFHESDTSIQRAQSQRGKLYTCTKVGDRSVQCLLAPVQESARTAVANRQS